MRTQSDVLAAVETLETSYSYERDRWIGAYVALREVEREFNEQLKPYSWVLNLFATIGLASGLGMIVWLFTRIGAEAVREPIWLQVVITVVLTSVPTSLISFGGWLRLHLASRRHPLLLLKTRVQSAMGRYRSLVTPPIMDTNG